MKNSLESLKSFEILNAQELVIIQGGTEAPVDHSKKKDVDSESNDSYKKD